MLYSDYAHNWKEVLIYKNKRDFFKYLVAWIIEI